MHRDTITEHLDRLPGEIRDAETKILQAAINLQEAKEAHGRTVATLHLNDMLTGKNQAVRDAQEFDATTDVRATVRRLENTLAAAKADLQLLRDTFTACRTLAALLAAEDTP